MASSSSACAVVDGASCDIVRASRVVVCVARPPIGRSALHRARSRSSRRAMNQPSRADRFVLPEGERKLSYERDIDFESESYEDESECHHTERCSSLRLPSNCEVIELE